MRKAVIVVFGAMVACAYAGACGNGSSSSSTTTTVVTIPLTTAPPETTTVPPTTTTAALPADCSQAITNVKTAIVNGANSVDADPATENNAGVPIFTAFTTMGVACHAEASTAISDVIQFLSTQAPQHKPPTAKAINAVIKAFCNGVPKGTTLTPEAQGICGAHR
jgi:Fe-S cluster biogenesis protein NfuA